jgi:hypothetical protein
MHHLASIYQAGVDFAKRNPDDVLRIQQSLDQVTAMIYARIGVGLNEAYSATLLIHPEGEEPDELPPPEEAPVLAAPATEQAPAQAQAPAPEAAPYLQPDLSTLAPSADAEQAVVNQEAKPVPA